MFYFVYIIYYAQRNSLHCYTNHQLFYAFVPVVVYYYRATVSAHSSLVVLLVFIDTYIVLYDLYLSK